MPTTSPAGFSTEPIPFTMVGVPLLEAGRSNHLLARSPELWVYAKVYAEGGENGLHAHPIEDHLFFVLAGRAEFHDGSGGVIVVGPYGGIVIPAGAVYSFVSAGDENLVMLRVGTSGDRSLIDRSVHVDGDEHPAAMLARMNVDGSVSVPGDGKNGTTIEHGVVAVGEHFGSMS